MLFNIDFYGISRYNNLLEFLLYSRKTIKPFKINEQITASESSIELIDGGNFIFGKAKIENIEIVNLMRS